MALYVTEHHALLTTQWKQNVLNLPTLLKKNWETFFDLEKNNIASNIYKLLIYLLKLETSNLVTNLVLSEPVAK